jgi:hypothetical protein
MLSSAFVQSVLLYAEPSAMHVTAHHNAVDTALVAC